MMAAPQLRIVTLNINGTSAVSRLAVLEQFVRSHDLDVILLQEVVSETVGVFRGYTTYTNVGTEQRGTAIVMKDHLELRRIVRLPTGRGMAGELQGIWLVNIYAPSGAAKRREREDFFAVEVPVLLSTVPDTMLMGGDFNCVLSQAETTGKASYSSALRELITGYGLVDAWEAGSTRGVYTHYTRLGASRIDRLYMTKNIVENKCGVETIPVAMTDHMAVALRVRWQEQPSLRGKGRWMMNVSLLEEAVTRQQLGERWNAWRRNAQWYGSMVDWWVSSVKRRIRKFFMAIGAERRREANMMENHYYNCIYEILQNLPTRPEAMTELNKFKAKIVNIYSKRMGHSTWGAEEADKWADERVSIYHIVQQKRRRERQTMRYLIHTDGTTLRTSKDILMAFWENLRRKYSKLQVDEEAMAELLAGTQVRLNEQDRWTLDQPLRVEELRQAMSKGGSNKTPGPDGLGKDLFLRMWEDWQQDFVAIFTDTFDNCNIKDQQKQGLIVVYPKRRTR